MNIHNFSAVWPTVVFSAVLTLPGVVFAQGESASKSSYTLLNPAPRDQMRPLSTGRPDATDSAITVDAGHFQIETSLVSFARLDLGNVLGGSLITQIDNLAFLETSLKMGLLNDLDFEFVFAPYSKSTYYVGPDSLSAGATGVTFLPYETVSFPTLWLRAKYNILGNDGGDIALAVIPSILAPIAMGYYAHQSLTVVGSYSLTGAVGLAAQVVALNIDSEAGYRRAFSYAAVLGFSVDEAIGLYIDYTGDIDSSKNHSHHLGSGITYGVSDDFQLDIGGRYGRSFDYETSDWAVATGFSYRY